MGGISVSESLGGEWEQGNWGTGTERRGNWEGNGNSEIVGRFLLGTVKLLNANGELYKPVITKL